MKLDDPRIQLHQVDGQRLYVPNGLGWAALERTPELDGRQLPAPALIAGKVRQNSAYPEILCALGFAWNRVCFYELLDVEGSLFRVFVERVICEHYRRRPLVSATPGVSEIYWGSVDESAARSRGFSLPNLSCRACLQPYSRRHTVWQRDVA